MVMVRAAYGAVSRRSERLWRLRPATRSVVLVAMLAVLGLAGCAASTRSVGSASAAPTTGLSSPLANIRPLPATLGGGRFDPAVLAGKPVVLWFWAPWCSVCRSEGPTIAKVAAQFTGRVRFIGVAGEDTVPAMTAFIQQTGTGALTHLADVNGVVWRDYGVSVQPAFAFISPDGTANLRIGSLEEQTLRMRVADLAAGTPASNVTMTPGLYCSRAPDGRTLCGASGPPHSSPTSTTHTP